MFVARLLFIKKPLIKIPKKENFLKTEQKEFTDIYKHAELGKPDYPLKATETRNHLEKVQNMTEEWN
jgi:hypothetical protein